MGQRVSQEPIPAWVPKLRSGARFLAAGLWAGLISGAVVGGVGGRLAMYVLRLTSDPSLAGLQTDDGFTVGEFTFETIFLILFATVLGTVGGAFYLLIRGWLPGRFRALLFGLFGAAVGGAVVVHPDGVDFFVLEPLWLAIAMFVALPAVYGVSVSLLAERLLRSGEPATTSRLVISVLPLAGLVLMGPPGLAILIAAALGWLLNLRVPVAKWWRSRPVTIAGRIALLVCFGFALSALLRDSMAIL